MTDSGIAIDSGPHGQPPLMLVFQDDWVKQSTILHVRDCLERAYRDGTPIIVERAKVYQCIDGRWEPLP